ncbi:hypothetical protein ACO2Q8_13590 [Larkinella sp. VNQ87]|uniref:hypothetical protein n=1 Tax=Larkinella sp. VNQ87 TaxID=3400921 RepID=UPI003C0DF10B
MAQTPLNLFGYGIRRNRNPPPPVLWVIVGWPFMLSGLTVSGLGIVAFRITAKIRK